MAAKTAGRTRRVKRRATADGTGTRELDSVPPGQRMPNLPDWRWRSFPVLAAFIAGILLDAIINPPQSDAAIALRVLAVLGAGYCLAHVFVVNTIVARRIKARESAVAPGAEEDDDWVDEVVHPDDRPSSEESTSRAEPRVTP